MSRRVLVTGGASGLGAALVRRFAERGDRVLVTDLADEIAAGAAGGETPYRKLDVCSDADWEAAREWCEREWGGLDLLVNNAGIATGGRIDVATMDEWDRAIDINLKGVVRGCRIFVPLFKNQRSGHVVNVASLAGLVHPPMMSSYVAVKAGVVAMSETLSHELAPYGVLVSVVCPSFFRTNITSSLQSSDTETEASARRLIETSKLTADDIAGAVIEGIDRRRRLILTDRPARAAWRSKRWARPLYDRTMRRIAQRAYQRNIEHEAARAEQDR